MSREPQREATAYGGQPSPGSQALAGRTVLVARPDERGAALAVVLEGLGAQVLVAPVTASTHPDVSGDLHRAVADLGAYDWIAVTSVNSVLALAEAAKRNDVDLTGARAHWAAVGPATAAALHALGVEPELVASGTAAALVEAFRTPSDHDMKDAPPTTAEDPAGLAARPEPAEPGAAAERSAALAVPRGPAATAGPAGPRVLLPLGDLASGTLERGLLASGWAVDRVIAYRTVPADLPHDVVAAARERRLDLAVVAAGSAARELARQLGGDAPPVVTIGEPSAAAAREAGLDVAGVAAEPTDQALAACVTAALTRQGAPGWNPGATASGVVPTGADA